MAAETYSASGTKAPSKSTLDKAVFGVEVANHQLLKEAYLGYLANGRTNNAKTKKRGEVRGGGRKPWRQKGTGRARFGSSRNPIWRGGGISFGPTGNENYTKRLTSKSRRQALRQALILKNSAGAIQIIEKLAIKSGLTKDAGKLIDKLNLGRRVVFVDVDIQPEAVRAMNNLPGVTILSASRLSVFHVLNADALVITKAALAAITERLTDKPKLKKAESGKV